MLKLVRIRELIEAFPEFADRQPEFEKMPTCVFYFIYYEYPKLFRLPMLLHQKITIQLAPIDQALEAHPDIVRDHLKLLLENEDYAAEQEWAIEEIHLFQRELRRIENMKNRESVEKGNIIGRQLAADFLGVDFVEKMEKHRILRIDAKNGKSYWLSINGTIMRYKHHGRPQVCTQVSDIEVPWDRVVIHAALLQTDKRFCNMVERHR